MTERISPTIIADIEVGRESAVYPNGNRPCEPLNLRTRLDGGKHVRTRNAGDDPYVNEDPFADEPDVPTKAPIFYDWWALYRPATPSLRVAVSAAVPPVAGLDGVPTATMLQGYRSLGHARYEEDAPDRFIMTILREPTALQPEEIVWVEAWCRQLLTQTILVWNVTSEKDGQPLPVSRESVGRIPTEVVLLLAGRILEMPPGLNNSIPQI